MKNYKLRKPKMKNPAIKPLGKWSPDKKVFTLARAQHARSFGKRFMGLMGVSPQELDYALVFHMEKKGILSASIHMLFMRTPIDVVWADETNTIIDFVENARPWSLNYSPKEEAAFIIEMPPASIRKYQLKHGKIIRWKK